MTRVLIVGAGLTGCTLAWRLAQDGVETVLLERDELPGGLVRSAHMGGVLYEPHGSHIFHTEDTEVWELANRMTPFRPYRHRVDIVVEGKILNWPILLSDIDAQSRSEEIKAELEQRAGSTPRPGPPAANFEEWCLDLMGPILYERYIKPYTEKQWGRPARDALGPLGAAARLGALGQRPLSVPRPPPGLAGRPERLHRPARRPARRRAHHRAHRRAT